MKVIIAGGREFANYEFLKEHCDGILKEYIDDGKEIEVVAGRCVVGQCTFITNDGKRVYGVDGLAERYAHEHPQFKFTPFPADWKTYGRGAGPIRNRQMAEYGNMLIAFWNGYSRGTNDMICSAKAKGLIVNVIKY